MSEKESILIADDNDAIRNALFQTLTDQGYACSVASNGKEALELLQQREFSVALLDLDMPEMTGLEVLEGIQQGQIEVVPIVLTGTGNVRKAVHSMKLGAYDFLEKPAHPSLLNAAMDRALTYRRLQRASRIMEMEAKRHERELAEANEALKLAQQSLATKVEERTRQLSELNESLREEVFQRVLADQQLVEQERMLRAITDTASDAILMMDPEEKISFYSPAAERIFGWSAAEARGKNLNDLLASDIYQPAHQKGLENFKNTGTGAAIGKCVELMAKRKDNTQFPIEVALSSICINNQWHAVGIARDISQRKRTEQALRSSEEKLRQTVDNIGMGVFLVGPDRIIREYNRQFRKWFPEIEGDASSACYKILHGADCDSWCLNCPGEKTFQDGGTHETICVITRNQKTYTYRLVSSPIHDQEGKVEAVIEVMEDITEKLRLEEEANQSEKLEAVGRLAAGIAHEINTPTQYVGDNIEFMQMAFEHLAPLLHALRRIVEAKQERWTAPVKEAESLLNSVDFDYLMEQIPKAAEQSLEGMGRISSIVQAMKEFSHPGSEEKSFVDINQQIRSTVTVSRNEWKYVADLNLDLDDALPQVLCFPGKFNQVILNLIVNAAHAVDDRYKADETKQGLITISTRQDGEWVVIKIADTGSGIPEAIRHRIFEPFFTTKEVGRGTGQGLAIAQNVVVDKHGGSIAVESEMGKGSTFILRLPISP